MRIPWGSSRKINFWASAALLLAISCLMLFPNLGGIALLDPDEPVYGQTAKEMLENNDWLSPRIYGDYWYDKPPMYYWLVAGSYQLFGISEWSTRLPATVSALICVMLVFWQLAERKGTLAGFCSGLVLVTSLEFFYVARGAVTDSTLTLFMTAALLAFWRKKYILCYVFAALATVTKGPIGLMFPLGIGILYLFISKQWKEFFNPQLYWGMAIYGVIAAPWYVAMYAVHGMAFVETFLGFHNITRFTMAEHPGTNVWYYFLMVFLAGFFPWSIFLPSMLIGMIKKQEIFGLEKREKNFFQVWALFVLIFFSFSQTKLVSYILPMFPPMAVLTGCYLARWVEEGKAALRWSWPVFMGMTAGGFMWGAQKGLEKMPQLQNGAMALEVLLWSMTGAMAVLLIKNQRKMILGMLAGGMAVFAGIFVLMLVPGAENSFSCKNFVQKADGLVVHDKPLYVAKFLRPGYTFYSDSKSVELTDDKAFRQRINQQEKAYFAVPQSVYDRLRQEEKNRLQILLQEEGKLLLRHR